MILPKKVTASVLKELILSKRRDRHVKIQVQFRVMGATEEVLLKAQWWHKGTK